MAGCTSQDLPEAWRPLTKVIERGDLPGVGKRVVTTISPYLYTSSLDWFNERYPEGSVDHEALRRHEIQHAIEQEAYVDGATGFTRKTRMADWLRKYLTNKKFRWETEKRGYKAGFLYKRSRGQRIDVEWYARTLSGGVYSNMVSYEEALVWIKAVLNGTA